MFGGMYTDEEILPPAKFEQADPVVADQTRRQRLQRRVNEMTQAAGRAGQNDVVNC